MTSVNYLQVGRSLYKFVYDCRACGGSNLKEFISLGEQSLANSYHDNTPDTGTIYDVPKYAKYPLKVNVCTDCYHTQLSIRVPPEVMFRHYLYESGTSQTMKDHFKQFAEDAVITWQNNGQVHPQTMPDVLSIGSNDGSELDPFYEMGCSTFGVDPAENLATIAKVKGHYVITDYWSEATAEKIHKLHIRSFDIIIAQNVFAHTHDILGFLLGCKAVMNDNTLLLIQTSQANMYENGEFDTIYHEHLSFFSFNSMKTIVERAGLFITGFEMPTIHGTSFLFHIAKTGDPDAFPKGTYSLDTYINFGKKAHNTLHNLHETIKGYQANGRMKVVGAGCSAKGMTVLQAADIHPHYMIDESPLKVGLYTPGTNVKIRHFDYIAADPDEIVFLMTAWNFADEIRAKIKKIRPNKNDIFLTYFPDIKITG